MKPKTTPSFLRNKKLLLWGLGLTAVVVVLLGGSFLSLLHNKIEKHKLTRQSAYLDGQYQTLLKTKQLLEKEDPVLLEHIARTQYHLAKPGEIEFRFTEK